MTTETLYHATDASNVDSIQEEGLKPQTADADRLVFLAGNIEDAEQVGDVYPTIEDTAIFKAEVSGRNLMEDPEPHGDIESYAHRGAIPPRDIELTN